MPNKMATYAQEMAKQGAVLTYVQYNDYELDNPHFNDLKR